MQTSEFLFPSDLNVTPVDFRKVLFIGSCLSEAYCKRFGTEFPGAAFDFILFNNAAELPEKSAEDLKQYSFQYVQLPLRSILSDGIVRIADPTDHDWLRHGQQIIDMMLEKALAYNAQTGLLTIVSNFIVPQGVGAAGLAHLNEPDDITYVVRELNRYLTDKVKAYSNAFVADVDMIANSIGKMHFLDDILYFYTHGSVVYPDWAGHERMPHWTAPEPGRMDPLPDIEEMYPNRSEEFFRAVFRQIEAIYRTAHQMDMVKLVIFDLDNTMWRGQLVEHYQPDRRKPYADGWPMGVWEAVHHLKRRGIMVSIASKNDEELVKAGWANAVDTGFLKYEDFIVPKVNWLPKVENIRETMQQLSLTPKSVVFVDDNPVERDSVLSQIPGIRVIGSNPFLTRRTLLWAPETNIVKLSKESAGRENMLKAQVEREVAKSKMTRQEFLAGLNTQLDIWTVSDTDHSSFGRAYELVNKTNQFNTTGVRWSFEDFKSFFGEGGKVFSFSVKDKFTEYGTVGLVFVKGAEIQQYVMSCRVLGMEIENTVLATVIDFIMSQTGATKITAQFRETEANTPCRKMYPDFGFEPTDGGYVFSSGLEGGKTTHVTVNMLGAS
ncbi:FkbH-like protein [Rhizobium sp. BK313]|uniref:HAD-IIIC family phosphatase n=1 Tax=Rhizobium sp. BK313 TaxID=2587081 RepID=UPI001607552C|nr:HAD-IIIC family phosphatase [Rhizobium sp. BK313]MBB3453878.1 FkbH-like protein [Rhizobium sp. BK313]